MIRFPFFSRTRGSRTTLTRTEAQELSMELTALGFRMLKALRKQPGTLAARRRLSIEVIRPARLLSMKLEGGK